MDKIELSITRKMINSFNLVKTKDNYQQSITNKTKQKDWRKNSTKFNKQKLKIRSRTTRYLEIAKLFVIISEQRNIKKTSMQIKKQSYNLYIFPSNWQNVKIV